MSSRSPRTRPTSPRARTTRREALLAAAGALLAAGCGGGGGGAGGGGRAGGLAALPGHRANPAGPGSTLVATWIDPQGTGNLSRGPSETPVKRTELGPARPATRVLATLAHVTDAHVLDASSPARVPFLDRLGPPFQSTFRPQEALTAQVLAGAVWAVRGLRPDAVIQGGDLIDNDQANELGWALTVLSGGTVHPSAYAGVQSRQDADPFYYRPDLDAPRHPGLLAQAEAPLASAGLGVSWYPVLGDHDILVAGEIPPRPLTRALAVGEEAVWELPPDLSLPPGAALSTTGSPDGPPNPALVDRFLAQALNGPKVHVPADRNRRELDSGEVVAALRRASGADPSAAAPRGPDGAAQTGAPATLDYSFDVGSELLVIVLDLARRGGGSGGLVRPEQPSWLASQLGAAGAKWIVVVSHQPLESSDGGEQLLAQLDAHPRVIAVLAGHTHRNRIRPRPTPAGGFWHIETASLIDYPQQARALRVVATEGGGVAIQTWMLDHTRPGADGPADRGGAPADLGTISRQLAYLDAQGGRPGGFAGTRKDRNAVLYRPAARR